MYDLARCLVLPAFDKGNTLEYWSIYLRHAGVYWIALLQEASRNALP